MTGLPTIRRECQHCVGVFLVFPSQIQRGHGKFCTKACYDAARKRPAIDRFWDYVANGPGCWEWQGPLLHDGYGSFRTSTVPAHSPRRAHRFAYEALVGPIPKGLFVCHHCDNPKCVRPDHLFLGTPADNNHDCRAKGRNRHRPPKLTASQSDEVVALYARGGQTQAALARQFGMTQSGISSLLRARAKREPK